MRGILQKLRSELLYTVKRAADPGEARGLRTAAAAVKALLEQPPRLKLADLEREAIEWAMRRHANQRSAAAKELGICRHTLARRLKELDWPLSRPAPRPSGPRPRDRRRSVTTYRRGAK